MQQHNRLFFWSLTAALAGFLFGFDTVVISGADLPLQTLWPRGSLFHGVVVMSSALWGTVVGALLGALPTDRFGRKKTLIGIGILYTVSALGSALATDPFSFALFRFIGGIGVGVSTIAAPAFITEIAPADRRGRLVALYQFNIVLGILVAFLSNFLISRFGEASWRWMLGVEALPAVIYTLMVLRVPESPRWLVLHKGDLETAKRILSDILPASRVAEEIQQIQAAEATRPVQESIFDLKYRFPLLLAFAIAAFNQFSGINAFLYYAPRIFEAAGLGASGALLSSVGVGVTNLVFTLIGMNLIDKYGRKQLLYVGSIGYIVSLSLVALAFFQQWQGIFVPAFLFVFIASHAIGQGTVIWVFISEIFPNHLRAAGQAFGSSTHWVLAAAIPSLVPLLFDSIGAGTVFACFAGMMFLQLVWTHRIMPETRNVPLEVLHERLVNPKSR